MDWDEIWGIDPIDSWMDSSESKLEVSESLSHLKERNDLLYYGTGQNIQLPTVAAYISRQVGERHPDTDGKAWSFVSGFFEELFAVPPEIQSYPDLYARVAEVRFNFREGSPIESAWLDLYLHLSSNPEEGLVFHHWAHYNGYAPRVIVVSDGATGWQSLTPYLGPALGLIRSCT